MSIATLRAAVAQTASAIAVIANLTPVSGNKILPPTYAGDGAANSNASKHNMTKPGPDNISN